MTIKITGTTDTTNADPGTRVVLHAEADGREIDFGPFDRGSLLTALGAEPDETDYQEVLAENESLGRRLSKAIDDRDDARKRSIDLLERARAAEAQTAPATEEDRSDDPLVDRSWSLDKASEVVARLASVGVNLSDPERALEWAAEWILAGKTADRG